MDYEEDQFQNEFDVHKRVEYFSASDDYIATHMKRLKETFDQIDDSYIDLISNLPFV